MIMITNCCSRPEKFSLAQDPSVRCLEDQDDYDKEREGKTRPNAAAGQRSAVKDGDHDKKMMMMIFLKDVMPRRYRWQVGKLWEAKSFRGKKLTDEDTNAFATSDAQFMNRNAMSLCPSDGWDQGTFQDQCEPKIKSRGIPSPTI